jgi:Photosynthesis system II assembly factor YCF48
LARTRDGGLTWETVIKTSSKLRALAIRDARTVYAVGDLGAIYKSADVGATWNPVSGIVQGALFDIVFPTPETGFATGSESNLLRILNSDPIPMRLARSNLPAQAAWNGRTLTLRLPQAAEVSVEMVDARGKATGRPVSFRLPSGSNQLSLPPPLGAGIRFLRIRIAETTTP